MPSTIKHVAIALLSFCLMVTQYLRPGIAGAEVLQKHLLTAGWLESIILLPGGLKLRAKLDTGAKTSSLHAVDIERFTRDGEDWVRFRTIDPHENKSVMPFEMPLVRDVRIKRHKRPAQERPVVEMSFCLDAEIYTTEFSLIDRGKFNYPVLLGRRVLQKGILVDPAASFTLKTNRKECKRLAKARHKNKD